MKTYKKDSDNLEQIAKNKVSVVYEDDDEVHCT